MAGLVYTDDFLFLNTTAHEAVAFIGGMAVFEFGGHKDVEMPIVDEYHRQGDSHGMFFARTVAIVKHVPRMGICDVADDSRAGVEFCLVVFRFVGHSILSRQRGGAEERDNEQERE